MHQEETSDEALRELLGQSHTIAVLGMKDAEHEDAFRVPRYMQEHGHRILPVNPKLSRVLGEPAFPSLAEIDEPIDLVNIFRAPEHIPAHVDEILALTPPPKAV